MSPPAEWYRRQSEYNKHFYEWLHASRPDDANDWKVAALFYSGLHRVNYRFAKQEGEAPRSHVERNRRARRELPQVSDDCRSLYLMSMSARYRDGLRPTAIAAVLPICRCAGSRVRSRSSLRGAAAKRRAGTTAASHCRRRRAGAPPASLGAGGGGRTTARRRPAATSPARACLRSPAAPHAAAWRGCGAACFVS